METEDTTPAAEDKAVEEVKTEAVAPVVAPVVAEAEVETPVGDMGTKEETRTVDQKIFVSEKKARKAAEKELKALKDSIEKGASDEDVSQSISEIASEHNIDEKFLSKLVSTIKSETSQEVEDKMSSIMKGNESKAKFDEAFANAYAKALDKAPDFATMANQSIIKTLALQPENAKKTVTQLLEEIYGNAVPGKRTVETTTPGGGKEPAGIDYERAQTDATYFKGIMDNPGSKAKYNAMALENVQKYL